MKRFSVLFLLLCIAVSLVSAGRIVAEEEKGMSQEKLAREIAKYPGFRLDEKLSFTEICTELTNRGIVPEGGWDISNPQKLIPESKVRNLLSKVIFGDISTPEFTLEKKITILNADGEVFKVTKDTGEQVNCGIGTEFNIGDSIITRNGTAVLGWKGVAIIKINPNSSLDIGTENALLKSGEVFVNVEKPTNELKVFTPSSIAAVRGTIYVVSVGEGSKDLVRARTE